MSAKTKGPTKDLLGSPIPVPDPILTYPHAPHGKNTPGGYAAAPGTGPTGETCRTCKHACHLYHYDRPYWKCALLRHRWTHGLGTDIRLKSPACCGWEQYTDFRSGMRVLIDGKRRAIIRGPSAAVGYFEVTIQYRRRQKHVHLPVTRLRYHHSA